ncbi:MAG: hypothetical protein ACPGVN_06985 [Alphaproteobacteria bacterium]
MKTKQDTCKPKLRRACWVALIVMPLLTACGRETVTADKPCFEMPETYSSNDAALADQLVSAPRETVEAIGQLAQIRRVAKC